MFDIVVICKKCGRLAPNSPPDQNNPWGVWHWHQPCQFCGAEEWASHEPTRDLETGKSRV